MVKKQHVPRTKGNAKAANSERSAALLSSGDRQLPPMTAFFSTLASASNLDSEVEATVDEDFRLAIRRLWKKDPTTRLKALQQIMALLENKTQESIMGMLPFWTRNFNRLAVDADRRIREATFLAHKQICVMTGRNLAPFLKGVLATWLAGMYDVYAPAASAARCGFETVFPVHKHADVFLFYLKDTLFQFREILFNLTVATVPDNAELDQNEKRAKLARMLNGAFLATAYVIDVILQNDNSPERSAKVKDQLNPKIEELTNDPRFWKFAKHTESLVKKAFYRLLQSTIAANMIADLEKVTKITLCCLAEQDPTLCLTIWEASLQLLRTHPNCWQYINLQKAFMPQLKTFLNSRAFGNASAIFPIFLLFYTQIPEKERYRDQILANLREGLMTGVTCTTALTELNATSTAFMECIRYEMVHHAETASDILKVYNDHLVPILRSLLISSDSASDWSSRMSDSCIFADLQDLVLFLEKKSLESKEDSTAAIPTDNEKYTAVESIWENIYSLSVEALDSNSLKMLKKFYYDLNTYHEKAKADGFPRKARKEVRFGPSKEHCVSIKESSVESGVSSGTKRPGFRNHNNPFSSSRYSGICQRFLGYLLNTVRSKPSVEIVNLFSDLFSYSCSNAEFLRTFEKMVLLGRTLSSEIEVLLEEHEELAPAAVKVILRVAAVKESGSENGLTINALEERSNDLLLVILSEAFECDAQSTPLLRDYFKRKSFQKALDEAVQGPSKWDVLQACLHLCGKTDLQLFPEAIVKWLIQKLVETVTGISPKEFTDLAAALPDLSEELLQFCEVVHSLFDLSSDVWTLPDMSTLIKATYEASLEWGELAGADSSISNRQNGEAPSTSTLTEDIEGPEQVANRLKDVWAGALAHSVYELVQDNVQKSRTVALNCRLSLIDDIKMRICHASEGQVKYLTRASFELVGDDEDDLTFLKRLVPSSSELETICVENRIGDHAQSLALTRGEGPVILSDGDYLENPGEVLRNTCQILLEVCASKKAVHLIDINFLLLANFVESQPRLKFVVATLIDDAPRAASVVMNLARRKNAHWHLVLDSLLASVEMLRPNSVWHWTDCPPDVKQVFIQYERDEMKANQLLSETVAQVMASEDFIDPNLLCLASRCLRRASGESRDLDTVRLLNAMQGFKGRQPGLFDASSPTGFHLALCGFFIAVLTHCRPALKPLNWDFILLTLTSMVETFSWTNPTSASGKASEPTRVASRIWTGCGIALTEAISLISKLSAEEDENDQVPHGVRHEWKNFYQSVIVQTLIPLMTMAPKKLSQLPGIVLESVAHAYTFMDPEEVKKHWTNGDELGFNGILGQLCGLLITDSLSVQFAAYALASRIVGEATREHDELVEEQDDMLEDGTTVDRNEKGIPIDETLLECLKDATISMSMLTKRYAIEDPLPEASLIPTDRTAVSGYLLTCSLALQFCVKSARQVRALYIRFLEEQDHMARYLRNLFILMPRQPPVNAFSFGLLDERPTTLVHIICWSLVQICTLVPGVLRSWYMQLSDYKEAQIVEKITTKYVSPLLIERELANVRSGSHRLENVSVAALPSTREIKATYILDDVTKRIQISIQMDACHPLKKIQIINNCEQVPVSAQKWRQWLYNLSWFLNENGSIQEGLSNWKQNLDRRLENGGEECCICFSVVHMTTLRLPNYPCRTCRRVFHKTCIYKWLQHGHATCPACRTLIA
ncbi:E3 ubiquitin-protein ligase listerin-like isoform X2 [Varroa jacobsoni]|uniref:E3 ubiquitin-protein ligase listerin-like isoform X2 n=1 Tax=Varroa jacobsoni TaxID=62625 RepID=UPI000BF6D0BD|nr:E3 ubiquitin-protein ligase listerin-like isoform X2 [Varroa jacobsoni]